MEIEKKFLVDRIPDNLEAFDKWEIEQAYLCAKPTIRVRKKNDEYILTYKMKQKDAPENVRVNEEVELPLTKEAYEILASKREGKIVKKVRYLIPLDTSHTIELDVFKDFLEGLVVAEVEFASVDEAEGFVAPEWFGDDVSGDKSYSNWSLSQSGAIPD